MNRKMTYEEQVMNRLTQRLGYWILRCEAAERFIKESPIDTDIHENQKEAYEQWQYLVKRNENEN